MPTTGEKKALWFLAVVALSGSGVRLWRAGDPPIAPVDTAALASQIARVDSVRARGKKLRTAGPGPSVAGQSGDRRPATYGQTPTTEVLIDLDRAAADEIESLPGVGPALAQRIVANRDSAGPFGGIEALCDVSGIGRMLVQRLRPLVTFTGPRRPLSDECGGASKRPRRSHGSRGDKPR